MKQNKMYRYLGKNGIITSHVELINVDYIPMVEIIAGADYVLSNGEQVKNSVIVFPEELSQWYEIEMPTEKSTNKD